MKIRILLLILLPLNLFCQDNIKMLNSGKMCVGTASKYVLYINGGFNATSISDIKQTGITLLKGNFVNDVTSGNVFTSDSNGAFVFKGDKVQYIRGTANKETSYINFPDIYVDNQATVTNEARDTVAVILSSNMGISVKTLYLVVGQFILDSDVKDTRSSNIAHLLVNNNVYYNIGYIENQNKYKKGIIRVNLAAGSNYQAGRLMGFTPPFKKIYSDYFFYNFLSQPTNRGLFGDKKELITNPKTAMQSGKGYIVGLGVVPDGDSYYQDNWDPEWNGAKYSSRFTDKLSFARDFAPTDFTQYVNNDASITDKFTDEIINIDNVEVEIEEGWNYLGNPFTVPINMESFLNGTSTTNLWGVTIGNETTSELENKYYILSEGHGTYSPGNTYPFRFDVTYLVAQKEGSTVGYDPVSSSLIAPMQLFVVKKNTSGKKKMFIPKSIRTHGNTSYLRSQTSTSLKPDNELLIETRDLQTEGYDRICIVFRDNASINASDIYDAEKIFNNSGGVNQIYTKSGDNKNMTTNVIPLSTKSLTMYFHPAKVQQEVSFKAYRLQSLSNLQTIILEDTQTKIKTDIFSNPEYHFTSSPNDKTDRFILHFERLSSGIGDIDDSDNRFTLNYKHKLLTIGGLTNKDLGSTVSIFDIEGRNILQFIIDEVSSSNISKYVELSKGVHLVRITGNRTLTGKILAD